MSLEMDIKKSFGSFELNIQLCAGDGVTALLGASGCGKSMTLKCIAGIEKPDEGYIIMDGVTLFDSSKKVNLSPQKRRTGLLFQSYALFPNLTVEQNIGFAVKDKRQIKGQIVAGLISSFRLDGLERHYPSQLSGGQQQRVALARILASRPGILLLDEPFSALDSYLRWQLEQELIAHLSEFGGTTLYVSHNRDEVYRICDRLAVVSEGRIESEGDKWELFKNPSTYAVSLLTGCKNNSPAVRTSSHTVRCTDWGLELCTDSPVGEDIRFAGVRAREIVPSDGMGENCFGYEIVRTIQDTFTYILMIKPDSPGCGGLIRWEMSKESYKELMGGARYACIPPEKVLLLR